MRVTSGILSNNLLFSLNRNLEGMSKLEQKMSTGKKISKPSDDPIIASRSMKFRTNLSEIDQYERNVDDANSWMDITEQSIKNVEDILGKIRELSVQGANGTLETGDRDKIATEISQLKEQLVQEGNATYAGRYIFTGYKTDKKLLFDENTNQTFNIQQNLNKNSMSEIDATGKYKLELPYKESNTPTVEIGGTTYTVTDKTLADADAYTPVPGDVHFIAETGELIFDTAEVPATEATNIKIDYSKDTFEKGDMNPEIYFKTLENINIGGALGNIDPANELFLGERNIEEDSLNNLQINGSVPSDIIYANSSDTVVLGVDEVRVNMDTGDLIFGSNFNPGDNVTLDDFEVKDVPKNDKIKYEISTKNEIEVNTLGRNILTKELFMDITNLIDGIENGDDDLGSMFNDMIQNVDDHKSEILIEHSKIGAKINRLEMTENRLEEERLSFTELLSDNEDADIAKVMTELKSQEMVYNASLSIAAQIVKQSLVDYIR